MGPLKFHNDGNYPHAQDSNVYNFCWSSNSTKVITTFIGQILKGNNMDLLEIHNGGNYAHEQDFNFL